MLILLPLKDIRSDQLADEINAVLGTSLTFGDVAVIPDQGIQVNLPAGTDTTQLAAVVRAHNKQAVYTVDDEVIVQQGAGRQWVNDNPGVIPFLSQTPADVEAALLAMDVAQLRSAVAKMGAIISVLVKREFPDLF